jgi:hypothetical protein
MIELFLTDEFGEKTVKEGTGTYFEVFSQTLGSRD